MGCVRFDLLGRFMNSGKDNAARLHTLHERSFEANRFVYPVLSRRSGGISLGVNLNPDKVCNFDCIYCQVDRTRQSETQFVETDAAAGRVGSHAGHWSLQRRAVRDAGNFAADAGGLRRLNDIAFSGDGEPTTYRNFDEIIAACAEVKDRLRLDDVKMVLITNASMFHRQQSSAGWRFSTSNKAKSGPSSKPAPTPTISSSNARRSRFAAFSTTSRPRPACARW